MGNFMVFSQHLAMQVMLELCTLLKVIAKAHLELQAILADIQQNKLTWIVAGISAPP